MGSEQSTASRFQGFRTAQWVLRTAIACEFIGHGVFALRVKESWIPFITLFGFSVESARTLMPFVGSLDLALALLVLIRPIPKVLLWMTFWAFWTALLRPLTGEPIWDFLERAPNWACPLLLYLMIRTRKE